MFLNLNWLNITLTAKDVLKITFLFIDNKKLFYHNQIQDQQYKKQPKTK